MLTLLTIVHFLVCIFLIVIVLLQHGKGADMGASFGGGSGQTVFGTDGPLPLLNKITTASAIIFMFTSVTLAYYSTSVSRSSVMKAIPVAPAARKVETAPTPVEVPMSKEPTKSNGEAAPDKFPGVPAPGEEAKPSAVEKPAASAATPAAKPEESDSKAVPPPAKAAERPQPSPKGHKN